MLKNLMMGTAAVALSVTAMSGAANALIIDSFSTLLAVGVGGISITDDGALGNLSVTDVSSSLGGDILGGERELTVVNTGALGDQVTANVAAGTFRHNNGNGTGESLLRWDGSGDSSIWDGTGLTTSSGLQFGLGQNFAALGLNYIHISVLQADLTGSSVFLTLYTDAGNYSTGTVALPVGPSEHYLSLAAIASIHTAGTGVNLSSVNAIDLYAVGSSSFDVEIDIIEAVPEPASLTLLGAGIMGLGYFGKRRKA